MNKNLKKPFLIGILAILGGGYSFTFAQINVKSDLSNAIQNIQKVYFSPQGIQDPDPAKNILVELDNGVLRIHGKVIMETAGAGNVFASGMDNASIFQGERNELYGEGGLLFGGRINLIEDGSKGVMVFGGQRSKVSSGAQQGVIFAGQMNQIQNGSALAIAAGKRNEIEGTNSFVAGGSLVGIKGDDSFAAGTNIKPNDASAKNSVFLWSDNYENWFDENGQEFLKPTQDDTFLIRAVNGLSIGKNIPEVRGVDVQGLVQIGDQAVACSSQTKGAIKYVGAERGCFCSCNGLTWLTMTPSKNCSNTCLGKKTYL